MPDLFDALDTTPTLGQIQALALARHDDPATSHQAAAKLVASGKLAGELDLAWRCLREHGPCTSKELEWRSGYGDGRLRKRLAELKHLERARTIGTRECSVTGFNAKVWEAIGNM